MSKASRNICSVRGCNTRTTLDYFINDNDAKPSLLCDHHANHFKFCIQCLQRQESCDCFCKHCSEIRIHCECDEEEQHRLEEGNFINKYRGVLFMYYNADFDVIADDVSEACPPRCIECGITNVEYDVPTYNEDEGRVEKVYFMCKQHIPNQPPNA